MSRRTEDSAVAVAVVALVVICILGIVWMRHRTRLQEKRLEVLREMAAKGQATPAMVEEHLSPGRRLKSIVMVIAWFMLIGGGTMLGVAFAQGWPYRYSEIGEPGIVMLVIAVATLSTPLMLREMRRQNAH